MANKWKIAILLLSVILLMLASCDNSSQTDDDYGLDYSIDETEKETEPVDDSVIDLFRDVEDWFIYNNGDGNGRVTIEIPEDYIYVINDNSFLKYKDSQRLDVVCNNNQIGTIVYIMYSDSKNLREGDSFKVEVSNVSTLKSVSELLSPTGKRAKAVKKSYIYPNTGAFLTCVDDWKDEYTFICEDYIYEKFAEKDKDVWAVEEMYLLTLKPYGVMQNYGYGRVWVVAKVDLGEDYSGGEPKKYEVRLGGLAINADGELVIYENNIDYHNLNYSSWIHESVEDELAAYTDNFDIWMIGEASEKR